MMPFVTCVADANNYSIVDVDRSTAWISISQAALRHPSYAKYFFLGAPGCCIATRHATSIHAACVSLDGRGVLICGDSGAGKSTLSYACARAGWTYTSDDGSYLLNGGGERMVTGDCYQVRFRPTATELFPELRGLEITPRAAGKPSIEMPTSAMPPMICAQTTRVDFMVFLNRNSGELQELVPYPKDMAREFLHGTPYGSAELLAKQYGALEQLLGATIVELRYTELDWGVNRLRELVRERS
jgi:hypothetical protein